MSRTRVQTASEVVINDWTVSHAPNANAQATATQPALPLGNQRGSRNVCTGFTAMLVAGTVTPTAIQVWVRIIDGLSGGTNYLWQGLLAISATAGDRSGFCPPGLYLVGTRNTAMTIEFNVSGGANVFESVTMQGTTEP